jgi:phosphoribosylformylglycinamidine cyclo-ligase
MSSLTYKDSGVDITKGNQLIDKIKPIAKSTLRPGVLAGLGGFGAMFEIQMVLERNLWLQRCLKNMIRLALI